MKIKQKKTNIPVNSLSCLTAGVVLSILPHILRIPLWIIPILLALCAWKLYLSSQNVRKENEPFLIKIFVFTLMLLGVVGIYQKFGTLLGRSPGVSLLALLAGFKIFEIKYERDFYVSCFLGYFLVITNFLYTQTIGTAFYMASTVLMMTLSLVLFNDTQGRLSVKDSAKIATVLLFQSIPVMLILFVLFPRIPGALWGMPEDAHSGITGVDDEMTPGSISQLIQSNRVAFRVDFKDPKPEQSQLYWRGPVLLYTDGITWSRGKFKYHAVRPLKIFSDPITYTITLEAHDKKWLYALDVPQDKPILEREKNWISSDFQLLTKHPIRQRVRYDLTSYLQYKTSTLYEDELKIALQLPKGKHKKTKELIHKWQDENLSDDQIIERALRLFNEDDFYYTLQPPLLEKDRVDEFLFETKQGFCEHYANAFAVMMRAAGIPSRIVLGYQGGEYNPVGDYLIVHQRNAHAWTEVWRQEHGWTRIDPTAAVSPLRIIEGIESALPNDIFGVPLIFSQNNISKKLWQLLRHRWDVVNNRWNQWIINYGTNKQKEFLAKLGLVDIHWGSMIFLAMAFTTIIIICLVFVLLKMIPLKRDPVKQLYDQFCKKLSHTGIHRSIYEGPVDFAKRAALKRRDLAQQIHAITKIYISVRYHSNKDAVPALQTQVQAFKPARNAT